MEKVGRHFLSSASPCIEPLIAEQILQELLGRILSLALLPLLLLLGLRLCLFGGRLLGDCLSGLRRWCRLRWRSLVRSPEARPRQALLPPERSLQA